MTRVDDLKNKHTKAKLRDMAYEKGMSIPRGANKHLIARMLGEPIRCDNCPEVFPMGLAHDVTDDAGIHFVLCPSCKEHWNE